uniref:Uncharacterized protein n=1 Tax=Nelumbo nucifera TaxID=4432 RepID=A0A822Y5A6_NELNU|nr:TPA_asm: hypothetical protein HUJ06_028249 [Nelumbo nucifera]
MCIPVLYHCTSDCNFISDKLILHFEAQRLCSNKLNPSVKDVRGNFLMRLTWFTQEKKRKDEDELRLIFSKKYAKNPLMDNCRSRKVL